MALPIWGMYMKGVYEIPELEISIEDFVAPETVSINLDCDNSKTKSELDEVWEKPKANLQELGF
jgi:penicillin-binding protein 1A